jgi:hypothetical protein
MRLARSTQQALLSGLACALVSIAARGTDVQPVHLDYQAPPECPTAAAFFAQVHARTLLVRLASDAEPARIVKVDVTTDASASRGRLSVGEGAETSAAREVTSRSCDEVVAALALFTALALDPTASSAPIEEVPAPAPAASPSASAPSAPPAPASSPPESAPQSQASADWWWGAGVSALMTTSLAPDPLFGAALVGHASAARAGTWSPALRVAFQQTLTDHVVAPQGDASFSWSAARLDLCPMRLDAGSWSLAPCLFGDIGLLRARGSNTSSPVSWTRLFADGGGGGHIIVWLSKRLFLEAEGGVFLPWRRDRFYWRPNVPVLEVPLIGGSAQVGAGIRLP